MHLPKPNNEPGNEPGFLRVRVGQGKNPNTNQVYKNLVTLFAGSTLMYTFNLSGVVRSRPKSSSNAVGQTPAAPLRVLIYGRVKCSEQVLTSHV
jgi:hypothetical protein